MDDSKVTMPLTCEADVARFQDDMDLYYCWAATNNMDFNNLKFVFLRYGFDEDLKEDTLYFSNDIMAPIDSLGHYKDLGVLISNSEDFCDHIDYII